MKRDIGQGSLAEALVCRSSRRSEGRLDRIAALIDWDAVAAILSGLHPAQTGRPSYPPVVMMRALLLAQWYRLSDPELEEALADRLSFRRFVGLSLQDRVPDETTLCAFAACWPGAWPIG
ncbi:MAG: transposase [Acetobacteraceae bacterium]